MTKQRVSGLFLALLVASGLFVSCDKVSGTAVGTSTPSARPSSTAGREVPQWRVVARFQGDGQHQGFNPNPDEYTFTVDVPIADWKIVWTCDASHSSDSTGSFVFRLYLSAYGGSLDDNVRWFNGGGVAGNCGHPVSPESDAWVLGLQQIPTSGTLGPWTPADFGAGADLRDMCQRSRPDMTCAINYEEAEVPWTATVMEYR